MGHRLVGEVEAQLIFIGIDMDVDAIGCALDACVLGSEEIADGFEGWLTYPDPLPEWEDDDDDSDDLGIGA